MYVHLFLFTPTTARSLNEVSLESSCVASYRLYDGRKNIDLSVWSCSVTMSLNFDYNLCINKEKYSIVVQTSRRVFIYLLPLNVDEHHQFVHNGPLTCNFSNTYLCRYLRFSELLMWWENCFTSNVTYRDTSYSCSFNESCISNHLGHEI